MRLFFLNYRGFSLIEVIVVVAITTLVFGGLFAAFEYSIRLTGQSMARLTALSLTTDRLEYIRSLPYDSVGTISGIPSGNIPQNRTTYLNGLTFSERVLIEYVDDPADGVNLSDSNGIISDYKRIKVEYSWTILGVTNSFSSVSTIVPRSIETNAGGGTIRVNVFDATVAPLSGVDVRLINNTTTSTIDVTRQTDVSGTAYFTGAPAAANYEIFVSAPGYSSDQTYQATTSLPNPITLPVAVLESDVSTMNFQIDELSDLDIKIIDGEVINSFSDTFSDASGIATATAAVATSGSLRLTESGGVYDTSGEVWLNPMTPSPVESWGLATLDTVSGAQTDVRIQFYTNSNPASIIGDADLPGNSLGFTGPHVDLRSLSGLTFPTLVVRVSLSTTNTSQTPELEELTIEYVESESPVTGGAVTITGGKSIGTTAGGAPVPKNQFSTTTDSSGEIELRDIEWDSYTLIPPTGQLIADACSAHPFALSPGSNSDLRLLLTPATANSLRVAVNTGTGVAIPDATVQLTRPSFSDTQTSSWCGQVMFTGMSSSTDYRLEVSAPGYSTNIVDPMTIQGESTQYIILTP